MPAASPLKFRRPSKPQSTSASVFDRSSIAEISRPAERPHRTRAFAKRHGLQTMGASTRLRAAKAAAGRRRLAALQRMCLPRPVRRHSKLFPCNTRICPLVRKKAINGNEAHRSESCARCVLRSAGDVGVGSGQDDRSVRAVGRACEADGENIEPRFRTGHM